MIRMVYSNTEQRGDLDRTGGGNFVDDLDLETAVLISWFTERRLEPGDDGADSLDYSGGWWGDSYAEIEGDKIGSRLWRLRREVATQSNLNKAKIWGEEPLQWMLEDGVAESITVTAERGKTPIDLLLGVDIQKPDDAGRWSAVWEIQLNAL